MKKKIDLADIYRNESALRRYIRLTVGNSRGIFSLLYHEITLTLLTGLPGLLGIAFRRLVYPAIFHGISRSSTFNRQVSLRCPHQITLHDNVVIDEFVQLFATSEQNEAIKIGSNSFLRSYVSINSGPPDGFVHIGKNTAIGQGTILYGNGGLTIGDNVLIAGQCFLVASSHVHEDINTPISQQGFTAEGIVISDNVWIGAGCKILDGVTIGSGTIVGANSVVTKSVPSNTIIAGVPAKILKHR